MNNSEIQSIVIIRLSSIGDIVLTTPFVRAVRKRFPDARIDFIIKQEFAELMRTNPHINTLYTYDKRRGMRGLYELIQTLRRNRYHLFIDIHKNFRSYLLRLLSSSEQIVTYPKQTFQRTLLIQFGINRYGTILQIPERYLKSMETFHIANDGEGLELFPTDKHYSKVAAILKQEHLTEEDFVIGLGPIAAHQLKQWPAERFAELGQQCVQRYGARILLFGGPDDVSGVAQIAKHIPNNPILLCGRLSLLETATALERCAVFVTNDTGTVHIATAMHRKVVAIFGPTVREFGYYPYRAEALVIHKSLPCRPCTHNGKGRCKIGTHACMQEIHTEEVLQAIEQLLKKEEGKKVRG